MAPALRDLRSEIEQCRADQLELASRLGRSATLQSELAAQLQADMSALHGIAEALAAISGREHDLVVRFDALVPHLQAIERHLASLEERVAGLKDWQHALDRAGGLAGAMWDHEALVRRLSAIEDRLARADRADPS